MRESMALEGATLKESEYKEAITNLVSKGYELSIDPRNFDTPLSIKARFKSSHKKIRFIEFTPDLKIGVEHDLPKKSAKTELNKIQEDFTGVLTVGSAKVEDYELATLQMITRKNPILIPKDKAEEKLFKSLEQKKIFSKVVQLSCPKCKHSFMIPESNLSLEDSRTFCKDCNAWFTPESSNAYVVNEEYMKVMDGVWDKVNKIIRSSWREITKRSITMLPKGQ